jgi:hypothetical protein
VRIQNCGAIDFQSQLPRRHMTRYEADSPYAWFRLAIAIVLSTLGGVGMWLVVVALPAVQGNSASSAPPPPCPSP